MPDDSSSSDSSSDSSTSSSTTEPPRKIAASTKRSHASSSISSLGSFDSETESKETSTVVPAASPMKSRQPKSSDDDSTSSSGSDNSSSGTSVVPPKPKVQSSTTSSSVSNESSSVAMPKPRAPQQSSKIQAKQRDESSSDGDSSSSDSRPIISASSKRSPREAKQVASSVTPQAQVVPSRTKLRASSPGGSDSDSGSSVSKKKSQEKKSTIDSKLPKLEKPMSEEEKRAKEMAEALSWIGKPSIVTSQPVVPSRTKKTTVASSSDDDNKTSSAGSSDSDSSSSVSKKKSQAKKSKIDNKPPKLPVPLVSPRNETRQEKPLSEEEKRAKEMAEALSWISKPVAAAKPKNSKAPSSDASSSSGQSESPSGSSSSSSSGSRSSSSSSADSSNNQSNDHPPIPPKATKQEEDDWQAALERIEAEEREKGEKKAWEAALLNLAADMKAAIEPSQATDTKGVLEPSQTADVKASIEPTQAAAVKPSLEPSQAADVKPSLEPSQIPALDLEEEYQWGDESDDSSSTSSGSETRSSPQTLPDNDEMDDHTRRASSIADETVYEVASVELDYVSNASSDDESSESEVIVFSGNNMDDITSQASSREHLSDSDETDEEPLSDSDEKDEEPLSDSDETDEGLESLETDGVVTDEGNDPPASQLAEQHGIQPPPQNLPQHDEMDVARLDSSRGRLSDSNDTDEGLEDLDKDVDEEGDDTTESEPVDIDDNAAKGPPVVMPVDAHEDPDAIRIVSPTLDQRKYDSLPPYIAEQQDDDDWQATLEKMQAEEREKEEKQKAAEVDEKALSEESLPHTPTSEEWPQSGADSDDSSSKSSGSDSSSLIKSSSQNTPEDTDDDAPITSSMEDVSESDGTDGGLEGVENGVIFDEGDDDTTSKSQQAESESSQEFYDADEGPEVVAPIDALDEADKRGAVVSLAEVQSNNEPQFLSDGKNQVEDASQATPLAMIPAEEKEKEEKKGRELAIPKVEAARKVSSEQSQPRIPALQEVGDRQSADSDDSSSPSLGSDVSSVIKSPPRSVATDDVMDEDTQMTSDEMDDGREVVEIDDEAERGGDECSERRSEAERDSRKEHDPGNGPPVVISIDVHDEVDTKSTVAADSYVQDLRAQKGLRDEERKKDALREALAFYNKRVVQGEPESEELYLSIFEKVLRQKEEDTKHLDLKHDQLLEKELERQNAEKSAKSRKKDKKGKKDNKDTKESKGKKDNKDKKGKKDKQEKKEKKDKSDKTSGIEGEDSLEPPFVAPDGAEKKTVGLADSGSSEKLRSRKKKGKPDEPELETPRLRKKGRSEKEEHDEKRKLSFSDVDIETGNDATNVDDFKDETEDTYSGFFLDRLEIITLSAVCIFVVLVVVVVVILDPMGRLR